MIDKVGSSNLLHNYKMQTQEKHETTVASTKPEIAKDIVDKQTADATKAYVQSFIAPPKREIPPHKTSEERINDLINAGKVEEKDFIVDKSDKLTSITTLKDGKSHITFDYYKEEDNKESYESYTEYQYPLDTPNIASEKNIKSPSIKYTSTSYTADGEFKFRITCYDSKNSPYQNEEINANTTSKQLQEYLDSKNMPYTSNLNLVRDDGIEHIITVFDKNTNKFIRYKISENKDFEIERVEKDYLDEKGHISHSIEFTKDKTYYTEFKDSFVA